MEEIAESIERALSGAMMEGDELRQMVERVEEKAAMVEQQR